MSPFAFDGAMSREMLNRYLSRAVTHCGIGFDSRYKSPNLEDDLRMFQHMGAKYIGRAAMLWTKGFIDDGFFFYMCKKFAARAHEVDPEFLLQACVFEAIDKALVDGVPIPARVFEAFGLPAEKRCFRCDDMLFTDGTFIDHWAPGESVPDITRIETRLWFYYRATAFIDAGYEGIHFGQVGLIGRNDPDLVHWRQVVEMTRAYARENARRHTVVIDAHLVGTQRRASDLFDFNSFPIRLKEVLNRPMACVCEEGYLDGMFNEEDAGLKPFLVEFDNFGRSDRPGSPTPENHFAWGYDEITWYALQDAPQRHEFLRYIVDWVNTRYPQGWVQFPSRRVITSPVHFTWHNPSVSWLRDAASWEGAKWTLKSDGSADIERQYYSANNPSDACPFGFGDEDVIAELMGSQAAGEEG